IARLDPELFREFPEQPAPLAPWLRRWIAAGLVEGSLYQGKWTDVGTPERLRIAERDCAEAPSGL
ncbi:mannose-1-phosphate guanylyltransferase, partial [Acidithiobacillus ferridurans]|nr:mannose-1-phosphate guanylyltransferase [Acidithiobacillus ferridurans]